MLVKKFLQNYIRRMSCHKKAERKLISLLLPNQIEKGTPVPITGECFCGKVKYQIDGRLRDARSCHCSRCRKAFSAQASAYALVIRQNSHGSAARICSHHMSASRVLAYNFAKSAVRRFAEPTRAVFMESLWVVSMAIPELNLRCICMSVPKQNGKSSLKVSHNFRKGRRKMHIKNASMIAR